MLDRPARISSGPNDVRDGIPGAERPQGPGHRWTVNKPQERPKSFVLWALVGCYVCPPRPAGIKHSRGQAVLMIYDAVQVANSSSSGRLGRPARRPVAGLKWAGCVNVRCQSSPTPKIYFCRGRSSWKAQWGGGGDSGNGFAPPLCRKFRS